MDENLHFEITVIFHPASMIHGKNVSGARCSCVQLMMMIDAAIVDDD